MINTRHLSLSDFANIVEEANDIILVTDDEVDEPGPRIVYVNKAFTRLTGYTPEEVLGKSPRMLQFSKTSQRTRQQIRQAMLMGKGIRAEIRNISKSGREYWLDMNIIPLRNKEGVITHFAAIERDSTEQRQALRKLQKAASRDNLTGLYEKTEFHKLEEKLFHDSDSESPYSLIILDVDFFKQLNDQYGHLAGDMLLTKLGDLLLAFFRKNDYAGRVGGEEFAILLPDTSLSQAEQAAARLRQAIAELQVEHEGRVHCITASLGLSQSRQEDEGPEDVYQRADDALYQAKQMGRDRYCSKA